MDAPKDMAEPAVSLSLVDRSKQQEILDLLGHPDALGALEAVGAIVRFIRYGDAIAGVAIAREDGELMLRMASEFSGRGIGTRAMKLLVKEGFQELPVDMLWAKARIGTAGHRVGEKAGLTEKTRDGSEVFFECFRPKDRPVATDRP